MHARRCLIWRADILGAAAGAGAAAGLPGQAPPTHNPLYSTGDHATQGAIAGHPVSPGSTPRGTHVTSGSGSETLANLSPGAGKHISSICGVQRPFLTCMLHQCQQPHNNSILERTPFGSQRGLPDCPHLQPAQACRAAAQFNRECITDVCCVSVQLLHQCRGTP